ALQQNLGHMEPPIVVVLSGGNIDPLLLLNVIRFGLGASGRYFAFQVRVEDRPGELARLLGLVAETGANLVGVEHHREGVGTRMGEVDVILQVETRGRPHIEELITTLAGHGYHVDPL
ncbi:MAG: threonine dehydratase, partial [Actinomycetota bacterium]|nr:threonine dehydratase [Actinomycetota bacterium]